LAAVTTERDTAIGALQVAKVKAENNKAKAATDAAKMAKEHAAFITEAGQMGHATADLTLGDYDADAIRRTVLENKGMKFSEDESADVIRGAWLHALANLSGGSARTSVLDKTTPEKIETATFNSREKTEDAVRQSYFGGGKKKPAKKEA